MFAQAYFADRYFPGRYFPHVGGGLLKPRYFYHGYFANSYFADRYFPGDPVSVIPPIPPIPVITSSGGPAPPELVVVQGHLHLWVPVPRTVLQGTVSPTDAGGGLELPVAVPDAEMVGTRLQVGILDLPVVRAGLDPGGFVMAPRVKTVGTDDADLQAHYLLCLK